MSYEQSVEQYSSTGYREQIDAVTYIATGTLKPSWKKGRLAFTVNAYLKAPESFRKEKKIKVQIKEVEPNRIKFSSARDYDFSINTSQASFWVSRKLGIDGIYWPGDCSPSLTIYEGEKYLVFLNENMVVKSLIQVHENNDGFVSAVKSLVANSEEPYGHIVNFKKFAANGANVQLLETESCLPVPKYRLLATNNTKAKVTEIVGEPIRVIIEDPSNRKFYLSEEELELALSKGLKLGKFRNVPDSSYCRVGKKYISVGSYVTYSEVSGSGGMFVPEEDGYFDLSKTIYEHHFQPTKVSPESVLSTIYATKK